MIFLLLTCQALMSNASLSLTCHQQLLLCINCLLMILIFFLSFVDFSDECNRLPASEPPKPYHLFRVSQSNVSKKKTRRTFVFNMSHVLTGVNSMVCVQLMLQTEPLGTVLALVGFLSSVLSWMRMSLCSISASFYVAPCAGLTCHGENAKRKGLKCDCGGHCGLISHRNVTLHLKCWNWQSSTE